MATRVVAGGELLGVDQLEIKLAALVSHVQREKERVNSNFQQLHSILALREYNLMQEMDGIVIRAKRELTEKREILKELDTAREGLEKDLTKNKLTDVLEKNLRTLEDKIGEEVSKGVSVGWVELEWNKEQLEQSVSEVCKVVTLKERPFRSEDYSLKLSPVWSREGTGPGEIKDPFQIAIDATTHNILVTDSEANIIQVFNENGKHLHQIPTSPFPIGIAITEEFIFVSTQKELTKIKKSNDTPVGSVDTENEVWGIDVNKNNTNVYGCENLKLSVIVFDDSLNFLSRINLKSPNVKTNTKTHSIKLYKDSMYVMFGGYPPFHLQIFSLDGELVRSLIPEYEIEWSYFFTIDQLGNIIVADWSRGGNQIKVFSNNGETIHTISDVMLPGGQKFDLPRGIAVDNRNRIIISQKNRKCCLQAF